MLRDEGNVRGYVQYLSYDIPALLRPPRCGDARPCWSPSRRRRPGLVVRLVAALQRVPYVYYAADVWSDAAASTGAPAPLVSVLRKSSRGC